MLNSLLYQPPHTHIKQFCGFSYLLSPQAKEERERDSERERERERDRESECERERSGLHYT